MPKKQKMEAGEGAKTKIRMNVQIPGKSYNFRLPGPPSGALCISKPNYKCSPNVFAVQYY